MHEYHYFLISKHPLSSLHRNVIVCLLFFVKSNLFSSRVIRITIKVFMRCSKPWQGTGHICTKTDGFTGKENTMLSTMPLERRSNKIIIICTCTMVPPLVQELPEGSWTQPVKLAVRTSPTWKADRYQGTVVKTAQPVLSTYPKRDGTFNQTKENFLLA